MIDVSDKAADNHVQHVEPSPRWPRWWTWWNPSGVLQIRITDNGSSHRGERSVQRMRKAWPTAHLVHTPVHASWLDQAEIYFSVVQRKVVAPNDFFDLDQIRARLAAFEIRYNAVATPFNWKFTRRDLEDLLRRIEAHENPTKDHLLAA